VVALWLGAMTVLLVLGLRDDSRGMAEVSQAKAELSASDLVSHSASAPLATAARQFDAASGLLRSPVLWPLDVVPVIGRQLRSVQDLSSASAHVARIGVSAVAQAHTVLEQSHHAGPERVTALRELAQLASTTDARLSRIDTGPAHALVAPLASKHDAFIKDVSDVRTRLQHASAVATAVADILQGPRTYLLLMANNAEMRAGSGDFLDASVLSTADGQLHMASPQSTAVIPVPAGEVSATGDLAARWGWLEPGVDWRNLGLTPQFDVNGPMAARMWQAETGQHVDGVIAVDVDALHQFLEVTGPVTLANGSVVSADNVTQFLVHDEYQGLSDTSTAAQNALQGARQDRLGSLAKATLDALQEQSPDLRSLSDAMTTATEGRHLLVWSSDPTVESAWATGGVAGSLTSDSMMAALINRGGNKLDQYMTMGAQLQLVGAGEHTDGTLTVHIDNHAPPGQSQFIAGPYPGLGTVYGEYVGILAVNVPGYARPPHVDGNPHLDALGPEGPTWLIAAPVDVKAGGSQTVVVRFTVPAAHGAMTVLPSARLSAVPWTYGGNTYSDNAPFRVSW
jgi:hypothetical protein